MSTGDKARSLSVEHVNAGSSALQQKILQSCKQRADQYVDGLIKQTLDRLDDALVNRSTKSDDEFDSNLYVEAVKNLGAIRPDFIRGFKELFTQNLKERFSHAGHTASSLKKGEQTGGLSLVDDQELEESLAVDGLVARARDRLRNELYALAQRFNVLIDDALYDDESQPYDPEVIGYAFRDIVNKLELKVEIKSIAYKLFEQGVMQTLGQFYDQINSLLSEAGILPGLKLSIPVRVGGGSQSHAADFKSSQSAGNCSEGLSDGAQDGMGCVEHGQSHGETFSSADVYQTLQRLMNVRKYGNAASDESARDGIDGRSTWSAGEGGTEGSAVHASWLADDLVRGLSLLQNVILPVAPGGAINVIAIKGALLEQMKQVGDERSIHPSHDNTIDVIGMIFEFILDEPSIPDIVKTLLSRLQIPILRIAIVDKEFFTSQSHPARRLLNALGHASIGWNDNAEEARQRRFDKMEYIVNRVLSEFERDPDIFATLLSELIEFLARDGEEDLEVVTAASESGRLQGVQPDRLAFETVEARLEGTEAPEVLRNFLRNSWRDVLQYVLDNEGHDSEVWLRYKKIVDELVWSVEPKTTANDRREMVMLLPRLLNSLREGMTLIDCSQEQIDTLIGALEPIHMTCLHGEKHCEEPVNTVLSEPIDDTSATSSEDVSNLIRSIKDGVQDEGTTLAENKRASSTADISDFERELLGIDSSIVHGNTDVDDLESELGGIEDKFTLMAAEMTLGTWLEFDMENKKRRGKLAWKSVVIGEYVFVDRKYKVVAERTLAGLAGDLRCGKASLVEHIPMFDRALDKVLNGLMSGGETVN